jgi:protein-L-isoaspartate O-methyltransferase
MAQRIDRPAAALRCPFDRADLHDDGESVRCPECGVLYRTRASEPIDFPREATAALRDTNRSRAAAHASRSATSAPADRLAQEFTPGDSAARIEPTLTDWRLLLGITRTQRVLEVGSGWGRLAFTLAPWVDHLYSLESSAPQIQYQQIMLELHSDANLTLISGSLRQLHFRPASLDWVIFNDVVGRLGAEQAGNPAQAVAEVMRQALAALKPGGQILLLGSNRRGGRYSTTVEKRTPSTHGLEGYTALLADNGAVDVRVYAVLPHLSRPRAIIPVAPPSSAAAQRFAIQQVWKRASPLGAVGRGVVSLLVNTGLMRWFYPYYMAVGRKPC